MAARHFEQDEFVETDYPPYFEPTREAFGECGNCDGEGQVPDFENPKRYDHCWNCGGDGQSLLTTRGAFHRTKPVKSCEMGILCVKDTVRHKDNLFDKDGFTIHLGKGTVLEMDHSTGRALVWWFTVRKKTNTYFDKLVKTGR